MLISSQPRSKLSFMSVYAIVSLDAVDTSGALVSRSYFRLILKLFRSSSLLVIIANGPANFCTILVRPYSRRFSSGSMQ